MLFSRTTLLRYLVFGLLSGLLLPVAKPLAAEESGFWIGLHCQPVSQELRGKIGMEAGLGLVVEHVIPDSPAAKAGFKSADVIFAIGDHPLGKTEQLADAVAKAKDGVLKIQLLRQGKPQVVEVKPAKRPAEVRALGAGEGGAGPKVLLRVAPPGQPTPAVPGLPHGLPGIPHAGPFPGAPAMGGKIVAVPSRLAAAPALPDNMKVTITKHGRDEAVILVEQGSKMWKTTEKETEMLPAEARAYVSRLLGGHAVFGAGGVGFGVGGPHPGAPASGGVQFFEFKSEGKEGKSNPAPVKNPAPRNPEVKVVPEGGIRIELKESKEANPAPVPAPLKSKEPKRPEAPVPPKKNVENELRELEEQIQLLRKQVEQLRKPAGEKR